MIAAAVGMSVRQRSLSLPPLPRFLTRAMIHSYGVSLRANIALWLHAGVSMRDGPSQMRWEDLAMLRPFLVVVLYPSDANQALN